MNDRMHYTLAALKVVAYGGPVALAMSAVGSMVLGWAFWDKAGEHYDVAIVLGSLGIVLGFLEWALHRRFAAHEMVEKRQYDYVASVADSAAQALTEFTKVVRGHSASTDALRNEVVALRGDAGGLARRVAAIEDRYMRPGLLHGKIPPAGGKTE